jgi:hypothetical protein
MFQLHEPITLGQRANLAALYSAVGAGFGVGLLSAGLSHASIGKPVPFFMMLYFVLFVFPERGWKEFCALLAMVGTFTAYFAAFEACRLSSPSLFL